MIRQRPRRAKALILATCAALSLGACDTVGGWFGNSENPPLPGKRIAVLANDQRIEVDIDGGAKGSPVSIGPARANASWPQAGGTPDHAMGHLALSDAPREAWRIDIGAGSSDNQVILGTPVIDGGSLITIDAEGDVRAFDATTGAGRWSTATRPENERGDAPGGGVAIAGGRVFVGTGYAETLALDAATGAVVWRKRVSGPVRGAPTVVDGRVYALTLDNQVIAMSADDGALLWTHRGIIESAGLLGANSVAVADGVVVAPYSSGEIYGLRAENGQVVWQESLGAVRALGALSALSDIRGLPVIDRGVIFAISHAGRLVAVDERTGFRLWERDIAGMQTPMPAGDELYVVTTDARVVALKRDTGLVRWVVQLERYENPEDRVDPIAWAGPALAGGRLWLTGSNGEMVALSPTDGTEIGRTGLSGETFLPPVIAGGMMYVLDDRGTLTAYR